MPETDIDALLRDDEASPDQSHDQQEPSGKEPQVSQEEQEFNKLSGSAQDRIRSLIKRAKTAEAENERTKALSFQAPPAPPAPSMNQDIYQAKKQLENAG